MDVEAAIEWVAEHVMGYERGPHSFPEFSLVELMRKLGEQGRTVVVRADLKLHSGKLFGILLDEYVVAETDNPLESLCLVLVNPPESPIKAGPFLADASEFMHDLLLLANESVDLDTINSWTYEEQEAVTNYAMLRYVATSSLLEQARPACLSAALPEEALPAVPDLDDAGIVQDLLSLVDVEVDLATVLAWSAEQREQARRWAGLLHLAANDNNVRVPPRPMFLPNPNYGVPQ